MALQVRDWAALLVLSAGLGALLLWLQAPASLLLGPLLAAIVVTVGGAKVRLPLSPFVVAQGVVGCMIAKAVPLSIAGDILGHWFLFTIGVLSVVAVSTMLGWGMTRLRVLPGTTALWGTSPGAASVMTIMSEDYGADMRLVAFMQYLRVVMVAGVAALVARLFDAGPVPATEAIVWFPPVDWPALAGTLALCTVGPFVASRLRLPAGAMLVPMVGAVLLGHFGPFRIELPPWLLAASFAVVGWNVGLRFTRPLLLHALRALPAILAGIAVMIALCAGVAALLVVVADVDPLTAYLATSPGGVDAVAIIASSTDVDVSFVMAMQTVRLIAVLFLAPALTRFVAQRTRL